MTQTTTMTEEENRMLAAMRHGIDQVTNLEELIKQYEDGGDFETRIHRWDEVLLQTYCKLCGLDMPKPLDE